MAAAKSPASGRKQRRRGSGPKAIEAYEHRQKRRNNPQAGAVTAERDNPEVKTKQWKYDPHLDPELNFDGKRDYVEKIISKGLSGSLEEARLALKKLKALGAHYLNWAGKAERLSFEVPTAPLHIHEKIDPRSVIEAIRRPGDSAGSQKSLFHSESARRPLEKEIQFYKHENFWSNRLIAGDSLVVMNSLLEKEGMGGKVQCVYIDPPYGIKYGSNFQPWIHKRNVKDKSDEDLTAEPETLKAFRDTWELGIHSYLSYLRDRLLLAKELLTDSGSCFVQISDENVHLVRNLMDEVFGKENFVSLIAFRKKNMPLGSKTLENMCDYLIWYAKDKSAVKCHQLWKKTEIDPAIWRFIELKDGTRRKMTQDERSGKASLPLGSNIYTTVSQVAPSFSKANVYDLAFERTIYRQKQGQCWVTSKQKMQALIKVNRIQADGNSLRYILYQKDFPFSKITNPWVDLGGAVNKSYAVQTSDKVIERCILMTTAPGDLVLDPTCGSGTTAYAAEKWGRRWITCDTSRVACALAKQRLMTAGFDYYALKDEKAGISEGFNYKQVPHITLKSIVNNPDIKAGMAKPEIEAALERRAPKETLYDQPFIDKSKLRVSGPFTVEAVPAIRVETLSGEILNGGGSQIREDWLFSLQRDGIKGKRGLSQDIEFTRLEPISGTKYIFAEGQTKAGAQRAIVCFGSEYAPLEQRQVELALEEARPFRPDIVIFCAFQFGPHAGREVDELDLEWTKALKVQMNSDLFTKDLKRQAKGESFYLVGQPDISLERARKGERKGKYTVRIEGFDYYDTSASKIQRGGRERIALWMLDTDYDGRSLFPRQIFFPMAGKAGGWDRLARTLRSEIDPDLMERFKGAESLPFKAGGHKRIAVKIIDDRGVESLIIKPLE